jgi:hypothetical protein
MIETITLEPGWLIQETQKAAEQFAQRLKRDFGVLDAAVPESIHSANKFLDQTTDD